MNNFRGYQMTPHKFRQQEFRHIPRQQVASAALNPFEAQMIAANRTNQPNNDGYMDRLMDRYMDQYGIDPATLQQQDYYALGSALKLPEKNQEFLANFNAQKTEMTRQKRKQEVIARLDNLGRSEEANQFRELPALSDYSRIKSAEQAARQLGVGSARYAGRPMRAREMFGNGILGQNLNMSQREAEQAEDRRIQALTAEEYQRERYGM